MRITTLWACVAMLTACSGGGGQPDTLTRAEQAAGTSEVDDSTGDGDGDGDTGDGDGDGDTGDGDGDVDTGDGDGDGDTGDGDGDGDDCEETPPECTNSVDFDCDEITVHTCKDLSNVVIELDDGTLLRFEDLEGHENGFSGDGSQIVGVWVKAGPNFSGDGPGYGERFDAPEGSCDPGDGDGEGEGEPQ